MALPNIFTKEVNDQLIKRVNALNSNTSPQWGKMSVDQMLAHVNIAYEMAYDNTHPKPNVLKRWLLKTFVKSGVTNEVPYKKNSPTAPAFIIKGSRDFTKEKKRLIDYLNKTVELGEKYFDQKESLSFGTMSTIEWNNLFYKHIDHHLSQFGM